MNKEESTKSYVFKTLIISAILLFQELYFLHMFTKGLLKDYGYVNVYQLSIASFIIAGLLLTFISISWTIMIYGMFNSKRYVKKFSIYFLLWTGIFPIWSVIVSSNVMLNILSLVILFSLILILLAKDLKKMHVSDYKILMSIKKELDMISNSINKFRTHKHN